MKSKPCRMHCPMQEVNSQGIPNRHHRQPLVPISHYPIPIDRRPYPDQLHILSATPYNPGLTTIKAGLKSKISRVLIADKPGFYQTAIGYGGDNHRELYRSAVAWAVASHGSRRQREYIVSAKADTVQPVVTRTNGCHTVASSVQSALLLRQKNIFLHVK